MLDWLRQRLFDQTDYGQIIGITRSTIDLALDASQGTHPNEFMALLEAFPVSEYEDVGEEGVIIDGIALIPGTTSDETSAVLQAYNVPNSDSYVGSVHSHPNGVLHPSSTDKNSFHSQRIHVIVGAPYGTDDWKAFDSKGDPINLPVLHIDDAQRPEKAKGTDFSDEEWDSEWMEG